MFLETLDLLFSKLGVKRRRIIDHESPQYKKRRIMDPELPEDKERSIVVPELPDDIIIDEIISRLRVNSLGNSSCVCKTWNTVSRNLLPSKLPSTSSWIVTRSSNKLYFVVGDKEEGTSIIARPIEYPLIDEFLLPDAKPVILGTCNGLVCFSILKQHHRLYPQPNPIYIFNPFTREHICLPNFTSCLSKYNNCCVSGLGFSSSSQEFKVVLSVFCLWGNSLIKKETLVYTLGSDTWRKGPDQVPNRLKGVQRKSSTTLVNGSLHWLVTEKVDAHRRFRYRRAKKIVSFNLETEAFGYLSTPESLHGTLGEVGGCLSIVGKVGVDESADIEIWVMKDYNVKESWSKLHSISASVLTGITSLPFCVPLNGEILLQWSTQKTSKTVWYNVETGDYKNVGLSRIHNVAFDKAIPFVGDLTSLEQLVSGRPTARKF